MPNMQMYSREEMEDMVKTESKQVPSDDKVDDTSHTSSDSEHTEGTIWQTIVQVFQDMWKWIKSIFGFSVRSTGDL